jgi:hypothetical protein
MDYLQFWGFKNAAAGTNQQVDKGRHVVFSINSVLSQH